MTRIGYAALAAFFMLVGAPQAQAARAPGHAAEFCGDRYCGGAAETASRHAQGGPRRGHRRIARHGGGAERISHRRARPLAHAAGYGGADHQPQLVAHPAGCPSRAFCGCGTAVYLLGKAIRAGGLAIAANWLGFPRAAPGPGMAAARRGHVFAIIKALGGNRVLAYDPNSGGHRTRIHVRSLAGYTVVNPHGRIAAAL